MNYFKHRLKKQIKETIRKNWIEKGVITPDNIEKLSELVTKLTEKLTKIFTFY